MSAPYQCPKCTGRAFVHSAPVFEIRPSWRGPRKVQVGYLVRCTRHGCGRDWVVTAAGMDEPAERVVPGRVSVPPPTPRQSVRDGRGEREPIPDELIPTIQRPDV